MKYKNRQNYSELDALGIEVTGSKLDEGPSLVLALLIWFLVTWVCSVCQNASSRILICCFLTYNSTKD